MSREDSLIEALERVGDAGHAHMGRQRQSGPAKMIEIIAEDVVSLKPSHRGGDARLVVASLKRQQHDGGGTGDGFEWFAEDVPVAIVDAAVIEGAIQQQALTFLDTLVLSVTSASQRQACPGRR